MVEKPRQQLAQLVTKPRAKRAEGGFWNPVATVRKYDREGNFIEEITSRGNLLTLAGRTRLGSLTIGEVVNPLTADFVRLGVGDDANVADPTDTNLTEASNEYYQVLDESFPVNTDGVVSFVATFGDDDANFSWQSWGLDVDDAGSVVASETPVELFNRKVFNFGEKDGGTWQLTVTVSPFDPTA
jgi:hypothetical protein